MKRAILAVLVMLVWAMPAKALTIVQEGPTVQGGVVDYIAATDGVATASLRVVGDNDKFDPPSFDLCTSSNGCYFQAVGQLNDKSFPTSSGSVGVCLYTLTSCETNLLLFVNVIAGQQVYANFYLFNLCCTVTFGRFEFSGPDKLSAAPVPIPAALPLFSMSVGAMGFWGWRSKVTNSRLL